MVSINVNIEGLDEATRRLRNLGGALAEVAYETGLLAAAKVISDEARETETFENRSYLLRWNFGEKRGNKANHPSALAINDAPHSHLINDGTLPRYTRNNAFRGAVRARDFFGKAAEATKQQQLEAFVRGVNKEESKINRELARVARGGRISARTLRNI